MIAVIKNLKFTPLIFKFTSFSVQVEISVVFNMTAVQFGFCTAEVRFFVVYFETLLPHTYLIGLAEIKTQI